MNDEPPMRNPESEDYYQWTSYKARMEAAIGRADGLQRQVKDNQQLIVALVKKAGGTVRLEIREYWHDHTLERTGVVIKREVDPAHPPNPPSGYTFGPYVVVLSLDERVS